MKRVTVKKDFGQKETHEKWNGKFLDENAYAITMAVAGFADDELEIQTERGVLTVKGVKANKVNKKYLHKGIADRGFERKCSAKSI